MVESEIQKRVATWISTGCSSMSQSSRERYTYAMDSFIKYYPKSSSLLLKPKLDTIDIVQLSEWSAEWTFVKHKRLYVFIYAMFSFLKFYYGRDKVGDMKDRMMFKQKRNPRSNRVLRDYLKIDAILQKLQEPFDVIGRVEWETGCRSGALFKMKFNIDLNDHRNHLIVKAITDKYFSNSVLGDNRDFFWKREDGYCFVLLEEKRGKILERVITPELYDWLVDWKETRLNEIRTILDNYYNNGKKIRYIKKSLHNKLFNFTQRYYNKKLESVAFSLGVQNFSSHWFRGTRATYLNDKGMDIVRIQRQLGHSDVGTTQRYIQPDTTSVEEVQKYLDMINPKKVV